VEVSRAANSYIRSRQNGRIKNKNGHDWSPFRSRSMKRGVVGNAQIATKPNDDRRRGHFFFLAQRARRARAKRVRHKLSLEKRVFYAVIFCQAIFEKKIFEKNKVSSCRVSSLDNDSSPEPKRKKT
jgi:hypothetical protein